MLARGSERERQSQPPGPSINGGRYARQKKNILNQPRLSVRFIVPMPRSPVRSVVKALCRGDVSRLFFPVLSTTPTDTSFAWALSIPRRPAPSPRRNPTRRGRCQTGVEKSGAYSPHFAWLASLAFRLVSSKKARPGAPRPHRAPNRASGLWAYGAPCWVEFHQTRAPVAPSLRFRRG